MARASVLDLFCAQGGAGEGYKRAGFEVFGVDNNLTMLKRNPHRWIKDDWRAGAVFWLEHEDFDLIHASPVCKGYSIATVSHRQKGATYPNQIPEVREFLEWTGLPYVIENVPGAPLRDPITTLCGSQFGLTADVEGTKAGLIRHRLFEASFVIPDAGPHDHSLPVITVAGHGEPAWTRQANGDLPIRVTHWREAMGIDWMSRDGLAQAIPPAYTEYIGRHFLGNG